MPPYIRPAKPTTPDDGPIPLTIRPHFEAYKKAATPRTAAAYLTSIKPILTAGIRAAGVPDNGLTQSHARRIALNATSSYDPTQGPLKPFISSHLQRLKRISAQRAQIVAVPERIAMQRTSLNHAETELEDRLGRPPSTAELADHIGINPKQIEKVRTYKTGFGESQMHGLLGNEDDEDALEPAVVQSNPVSARLNYLYGELDPVDQSIVEHRFGLHGKPQRSVTEIAAMHRLSPGAISQRAAKIARKLDELNDAGFLS